MEELKQYINMMCGAKISKLIISNPVSKECQYKKIVGEKKGECFQLAKYTDKQVFHENISEDTILEVDDEATILEQPKSQLSTLIQQII